MKDPRIINLANAMYDAGKIDETTMEKVLKCKRYCDALNVFYGSRNSVGDYDPDKLLTRFGLPIVAPEASLQL